MEQNVFTTHYSLGATEAKPQFLIMDYGRTYRFIQINLILLNQETCPGMPGSAVNYMDGVKVSLLDRDNYEVHICEELYTDDRAFEEAYQQTYVVSCHSAEGWKVKLETSKISPMLRAIAVVDTWAEVQIIFPGTVDQGAGKRPRQ